ncbi:MAG: ubiquinone/menaquinone biosynthesis methyltransferase [Chloroflexi bacterium]|nr:ubiquinone/menaquinone biosynthesis methyltransferase [Chloroflexota bacterium]
MTFSSPEEKRAYTHDLFGRIAPRYEFINRVMSLGQVESWRRAAAEEACVPPGGWVLDVATGEGGMARALLRRWPGVKVVGLDFNREMLRMGRAHSAGWPVRWIEGDALRLPFPDNQFDAVVNAFMLRNVTDVRAALAEQARVVRPGGRVVCLEMAWPRHSLFRPLFHMYFGGIVPVLGWVLTGHLDAYRYLPRSVQAFLPPEGLSATMEAVGLRSVRYRLLMMGTVTLHVGIKG